MSNFARNINYILMKKIFLIAFAISIVTSNIVYAKKNKKEDKKAKGDTIAALVSSLKFRNIGPSLTSGRISDFAFDNQDPNRYFVATAGGGVWKTEDNGTTFSPVFDNYGSYSTSCILIDPKNPQILWLGTGENNAQRSLSYGDGVYKSLDGGKSWQNMGLKESRQIGDIVIDPRDSDVVYVAAEGSVWGPGGDRGLYKTVDGGKTWKKILEISENSGCKNIAIDSVDPDIIYVSSSQRRRHVHIRIGGGDEATIYKTTDAGENWRKINKGLPSTDLGGIDIAISPQDHNVVYAIVEAAEGKGGFYRSTDRGETWNRMSGHNTSGQYFCEIYCDPVQFDKLYSVDTYSKYSTDGGKTWKNIGNNNRHVDDHAIWIDPANTKHFYIGGDGGVYETFNAGKTFLFKVNLPVTQYYRVSVDNAKPFYNVYGGTQDNNSMGGPSQSIYSDGVLNSDWTITLGGDGFWQAIEKDNPDIVYSAYQYGNIYRFDKKSGEKIKIKPVCGKGEKMYKWNWNTPFILSPHSPTRLYMAANKVFRSDDRGNSWHVISDDISRQISRDQWPVMGRYWSEDASVAKNVSTSLYGMAVELAESPLRQGLLYVGTDDGLIQVSEDDGNNWRKISNFPGVPEFTYVADIVPSKFDENVVFAAFDNHKRDDFKPYILRSNDKGKTWKSITGDLPKHELVRTIEQDYKNRNLFFAGTEHGLYFSIDAGKHWTKMTGGIPTVAIRDIAIQKEENDLILASFGRGFFILDDYSPLQLITREIAEAEAFLFPIQDALSYMPRNRGGYGSGSQLFKSKNPPFGANFTFYQKEIPKTKKQKRKEIEKKCIQDKKPLPFVSPKELEEEKNEIAPYLLISIQDANGNTVRKITQSPVKGIQRINWDLRIESPWSQEVKKFNPTRKISGTYLASPGKYFIRVDQYSDGQFHTFVKDQEFNLVSIDLNTLPAPNRDEVLAFEKMVIRLLKRINIAMNNIEKMQNEVASMQQLAVGSVNVPASFILGLDSIKHQLFELKWQANGETPRASAEERMPDVATINDRVEEVAFANWESLSAITQTQKDNLRILQEEFIPFEEKVKNLKEVRIPHFEKQLDKYGAAWTPGR
jgi:photosystem II stability/assembly factor-like uncharacterized protein